MVYKEPLHVSLWGSQGICLGCWLKAGYFDIRRMLSFMAS
ncbi:rCG28365, isoform CRA_a [Rattus norvegicus]|uniref:RCG28365, isoform CRA_a n=1 Tax=Rattus norvegicus TaxID=10116 RepID=A6IDV6_RAT|nr:rCG28365, isoform CRA_a [Rattus norvegicus]EDM15044.1 rCG28365, isoform CRA_a [Rattus norvegicus]